MFYFLYSTKGFHTVMSHGKFECPYAYLITQVFFLLSYAYVSHSYGALFGPQLFGHGTRVESHKSFGKVENKPSVVYGGITR